MEIISHSEQWILRECKGQPSNLLCELVHACAKRATPHALGHIKAYAEYNGGLAFAFSTTLPTDVTSLVEGSYGGGQFCVGITLIFMGETVETLSDWLNEAAQHTLAKFACQLIKKLEE